MVSTVTLSARGASCSVGRIMAFLHPPLEVWEGSGPLFHLQLRFRAVSIPFILSIRALAPRSFLWYALDELISVFPWMYVGSTLDSGWRW